MQTTAEVGESVDFELMPQAPAGMHGTSTWSMIGLAPELTLSAPASLNRKPGHVAVRFGQRAAEPLPVDEAVPEQLIVYDASGETGLQVSVDGGVGWRSIATGNYPLRLSQYFFDHSDEPAAGRVIVDFENLATSGMLRETPSGYAGFDWKYIVTTHERAYGLRGHLNNTVSGEFMAYTSSGHPGWVSLDAPFDFIGGYLAVSHREGENGDVILEGYRNEDLVYKEHLRLSSLTPVHFLANWQGIDKLVFRHQYFWQVVMDDLELHKH